MPHTVHLWVCMVHIWVWDIWHLVDWCGDWCSLQQDVSSSTRPIWSNTWTYMQVSPRQRGSLQARALAGLLVCHRLTCVGSRSSELHHGFERFLKYCHISITILHRCLEHSEHSMLCSREYLRPGGSPATWDPAVGLNKYSTIIARHCLS